MASCLDIQKHTHYPNITCQNAILMVYYTPRIYLYNVITTEILHFPSAILCWEPDCLHHARAVALNSRPNMLIRGLQIGRPRYSRCLTKIPRDKNKENMFSPSSIHHKKWFTTHFVRLQKPGIVSISPTKKRIRTVGITGLIKGKMIYWLQWWFPWVVPPPTMPHNKCTEYVFQCLTSVDVITSDHQTIASCQVNNSKRTQVTVTVVI